MNRIFISYKRVDKQQVFNLKDRLEAALGKKECWIDLDGIESDAQFKNVIIRAINNSEVFLFMYSHEHSKIADFERDWTMRELNFAHKKNKRIVFVNIDGSALTDEFEFDYSTKQQVDARSEYAINKLIEDLRNWLGIGLCDADEQGNEEKSASSTPILENQVKKSERKNERVDQTISDLLSQTSSNPKHGKPSLVDLATNVLGIPGCGISSASADVVKYALMNKIPKRVPQGLKDESNADAKVIRYRCPITDPELMKDYEFYGMKFLEVYYYRKKQGMFASLLQKDVVSVTYSWSYYSKDIPYNVICEVMDELCVKMGVGRFSDIVNNQDKLKCVAHKNDTEYVLTCEKAKGLQCLAAMLNVDNNFLRIELKINTKV